MSEWEITRSQQRCGRCETVFEELQEYYSAIYERPEGFERMDFCMKCWPGGTDEMFSFWKRRVPPKEVKPKKFVDDEMLIDFFERLSGATEELKVNFRYILALVLMRKRLLKLEGTRRDETGEYLKIKLRGRDAVQEVFNPDLTEEKIGHVTEEIGHILNVRL